MLVSIFCSAPYPERCSVLGGSSRVLFLVLSLHSFLCQDALEAYDLGLSGVVLSNHGGRQLDFARSGIEVLVEVTSKLKEMRGVSFPNEKFQLFVDGGVRRATDVMKAIALGATAGKPESHRWNNNSVILYSWCRSPVLVCVLKLWA